MTKEKSLNTEKTNQFREDQNKWEELEFDNFLRENVDNTRSTEPDLNNNSILIKKMTYNQDKKTARATVQYGDMTLSGLRITEDKNGVPQVIEPSLKGKDDKYRKAYDLNSDGKYGYTIENAKAALIKGFYELQHGQDNEIKNREVMTLSADRLVPKTHENRIFDNGAKSIDELYGNIVVHNAVLSTNEKGVEYISQPNYKNSKGNYVHLVQTNKELSNKFLEHSHSMTEEHFIRVEFNENGGKAHVPDYSGETVTKEMIDELKALEPNVSQANEGYMKIYFEEIQSGKIIDKKRMDLGDGVKANSAIYEALSKSVENNGGYEKQKKSPNLTKEQIAVAALQRSEMSR